MAKLARQTKELHAKGWTLEEFMKLIGRKHRNWYTAQCKRNSTELDLMIKGLDKKEM